MALWVRNIRSIFYSSCLDSQVLFLRDRVLDKEKANDVLCYVIVINGFSKTSKNHNIMFLISNGLSWASKTTVNKTNTT